MTKKEINQIYYYNKLVEALTQELIDIESGTVVGEIKRQIARLNQRLADIESGTYHSPQLDGMPRGTSNRSDPTGNAGTSAADIKAQIEELQQELIDIESRGTEADIKALIEEYRNRIELKRREVYQYISELDDALVEMIILYRCINLCTWDQVAANIGGGNTADSVRMVFNRHFEKQ